MKAFAHVLLIHLHQQKLQIFKNQYEFFFKNTYLNIITYSCHIGFYYHRGEKRKCSVLLFLTRIKRKKKQKKFVFHFFLFSTLNVYIETYALQKVARRIERNKIEMSVSESILMVNVKCLT